MMKKKGSFLSKLLLTYSIAALLPLFCITAVLFRLKWNATKQEMQSAVDYTGELLGVQLESIRNTMSFISLDLLSNEKFLTAAKGLNDSESSAYENANNYSTLARAISSYSYSSSSYRIVFFSDEGYFMTNEGYNRQYNYAYRLPQGSLEAFDWINTARTNYGKEILLPVSDVSVPNVDTESFSLVRSVRSPGRVIGFLAVQLTGENLTQLLETGGLYDIEMMLLCDDQVLYQSSRFPGAKGGSADPNALRETLKDEYLVSVSHPQNSPLCVVTIASKNNILHKNWEDFAITGVTGFSVAILTFLVICVFAHMMSSPLTLFTKKMQDTTVQNLGEDSLEISRVPFREIQILYAEFSKMRRRLDVMIENEITLKTLQSKERLSYLQAQINPHFLHNTLNIIGIMGADVGDDRIYDSCQMLSQVLKYAITEKESSFATFEEELENTERYLQLMKLRFEDKLTFKIECDEEIRRQKTLRIILQPFVENIFEHAFDPGHTQLAIEIWGCVRNGCWYISIHDNGAGMPEDALLKMKEDIHEMLQEAAALRSPLRENANIGIKNTLVRMSLYYGNDFRYTINNAAAGGFIVTLEGKVGESFEQSEI